ncbi:MAG: beta-ketoacyl-ACP synthase III [bacterium]
MIRSYIKGIGAALPKRILTNFDLEKMVDTSDDWIKTRTGIEERRIAVKEETSGSLAVEASREAIKRANLTPQDIDSIILATFTPDMPLPATACFVQHELGANRAFAFDIAAACSGFIYALSIADQYIKNGFCKHVLVIGVDTLSKVTDWKDRNTCVLFGDGAGAVVLGPGEQEDRGILSTHLFSDGAYTELLYIPAGGGKSPSSHETVDRGDHYIRMKGNGLFKIAVKSLSEAAEVALTYNKLTASDIDLFVPHQANMRIMTATAEKLGIPKDKICITVNKFGNNSAGTIPIAIYHAFMEGRIKEGNNILLTAFGGGLTWASALIRW